MFFDWSRKTFIEFYRYKHQSIRGFEASCKGVHRNLLGSLLSPSLFFFFLSHSILFLDQIESKPSESEQNCVG